MSDTTGADVAVRWTGLRFAKPPRRGPKPRKRLRRGKPPARKSRPRAQRKGKAADMRREAARLWSRLILAKAAGRCWRCTQKATDAAHVFPKGAYPSVRYDIANGFPLCREDHRWYTARPVVWLMWAQEHMPRAAFDALRQRALYGHLDLPAEVTELRRLALESRRIA